MRAKDVPSRNVLATALLRLLLAVEEARALHACSAERAALCCQLFLFVSRLLCLCLNSHSMARKTVRLPAHQDSSQLSIRS